MKLRLRLDQLEIGGFLIARCGCTIERCENVSETFMSISFGMKDGFCCRVNVLHACALTKGFCVIYKWRNLSFSNLGEWGDEADPYVTLMSKQFAAVAQ